MGQVRRGFPAQAERLATAIRGELQLGPHDRLDPRVLAAEYGIPLVPITELVSHGARPASVRQLTMVDDGCFSAGTVLVGTSRLIVFNPVHSTRRFSSSVAHELAHLLLEHMPGPAIGPGGCRVWDQEMEDEADLLSAILLVPRRAALECARVGLPHVVGAARFGVSRDLMRWRTDHSGATKQATAEAKRYGRTIPRVSGADLLRLQRGCDFSWLADLTAQQWRSILAAWKRSVMAGSTVELIGCLSL